MALDVALESHVAVHPRTEHLPPVGAAVQAMLRRPGLGALNLLWDVRVRGSRYLPRTGGVIIAANHVGTLDGPLLILSSRRPTFALAKNELFAGFVGDFLDAFGQIPLARDYADFPALRRAVHVLRSGHALGIFPEGARSGGAVDVAKGGAAYLALVTGAPIVPVAFLGTRLAGAGRKAMPPRGSRIEIVYGRPFSIPPVAWPRRRAQVAATTEFVRARLAAHVEFAQVLTGLPLPGECPEDQ